MIVRFFSILSALWKFIRFLHNDLDVILNVILFSAENINKTLWCKKFLFLYSCFPSENPG